MKILQIICCLFFVFSTAHAYSQDTEDGGHQMHSRRPTPEQMQKGEAAIRAVELLLHQGNEALANHQYVKAESFFLKARYDTYGFTQETAFIDLADLYEQQKRPADEIKAFRGLLYQKLPPGVSSSWGGIAHDPTTLMRYVLLLLKNRELEEAAVVYEKAMSNSDLNPDSAKPDIAVHFNQNSIDYRLMEAMAHLILGSRNPYHEQRTDEYKLAHLKQAMKLQPRSALIRFYMGFGLEWAGKTEEAKAAYKKAISLSAPDSEIQKKAKTALARASWQPQRIIIPADPKIKPFLYDPNKLP